MANNYLQFSWMLTDLTSFEEEAFSRLILKVKRSYDEDAPDDELFLSGVSIEFVTTGPTPSLWVYSEEGGDVGAAAEAIQQVLIDSDSNRVFQGTWAESCSKMRVDEFGGGGVIVTKEEIVWFNPNQQMMDWIEAKPKG